MELEQVAEVYCLEEIPRWSPEFDVWDLKTDVRLATHSDGQEAVR